MRQKIVITGIGLVTPIGVGWKEVWNNLIHGQSGIARITAFDPTGYRCQIAGEVKNWDPSLYIGEECSRRLDRSTQFAVAAARLAIEDAGLDLEKENPNRLGVCMGSGLGGMLFTELQLTHFLANGPRSVHPMMIPRVTPNVMASEIAIFWKLAGPNFTVSTACASGAHAIGQALMMLRSGRADVMVAGGTEAPILPLTFAGFDALRVMSRRNSEPCRASRPFDKHRDGFVMGEGSGILVLETEEHAVGRRAPLYAELAGYGASGGGHHMVAPEPTGHDALRAMIEALDEGEINVDSMGYINAHGTSTDLNDSVETKAIKNLLGHRARRVPVSSTKSEIGHLIGAAGGVEAAFTALALHTQVIPPTINYEDSDERCDLDYVPNVAREAVFTAALSNSFGFGNNNASLAFRKPGGKEE